MRVANRKRWLQAITLEREVMGHRGSQEQGHMQAAMESWLGSGWSMQESKEGRREAQGYVGARKQRGSSLGETPGSQFGEEEHRTPKCHAEVGGTTVQLNRIWDSGHPSARGILHETQLCLGDGGRGTPTEVGQLKGIPLGDMSLVVRVEWVLGGYHGSHFIGDNCGMPQAQK